MTDETIQISGISRQAFILRGAMAAGAVYGGGMVAPFVGTALGASGDADILNFALTLEYLEAAFYKKAAGLTLSSDAAKLAKEIGEHEREHVLALKKAVKSLGGKPVASPSFSFPISDEKSFLKLAQTLEDTGVSAYNGAGPSISSPDILAAAGSIVQVEARHAAAIRLLRGQSPAPEAFDRTLDKNAVLKAVKPLIKS
jgi:ferritin-like protein